MLESLLALLFVFGLLAGALWLLRRGAVGKVKGRHMEVIETVAVGAGKGLSIVRVGGRCFLLASGNEGVSMIAELDPAELPGAEQSESEQVRSRVVGKGLFANIAAETAAKLPGHS